jgi:hypothetical protein
MMEKLVERPAGCDYCPFEDMLTDDQRRRSVLSKDIPKVHISRRTIEQICGNDYDDVCEMKYVVERVPSDNRAAVQNACVGIFLWDLGKYHKRRFKFPEGFFEWCKEKDLGRGFKESYASRFREIWDLGDYDGKQDISSRGMYKLVVSSPVTYNLAVSLHNSLKEEHGSREEFGVEQ